MEQAFDDTGWSSSRVGHSAIALVAIVVLVGGPGCQTSPDEPDDEMITDRQQLEEELTTVDEHQTTDRRQAEGQTETGVEPTPEDPTVDDRQPPGTASPGTVDDTDPDRSVRTDDASDPAAGQTTSPDTSQQPPETDRGPARSATGETGESEIGETDDIPTGDPDDVPSSPDDVSAAQARDFAAAYTDVIDLQALYEERLEQTDDPDEIAALKRRLNDETNAVIEQRDLSIAAFNAIAELLEEDDRLRDRIQSEVDDLTR